MKIKKITSVHPGGCRHREVELSTGKKFIFHDRQIDSLMADSADPDILYALAWIRAKVDEGLQVFEQLNGVTVGGKPRRASAGTTLAVGSGAGV